MQDQPILQTERLVLQALCQGTREGSVREVAERALRNYRWREMLHQIVFKTLLEIATDDPAVVRDVLPSRLARKGFPDLPWEEFLKPHSLSKAEAERLIHELASLAS